jgi:peptide chain release factor 1
LIELLDKIIPKVKEKIRELEMKMAQTRDYSDIAKLSKIYSSLKEIMEIREDIDYMMEDLELWEEIAQEDPSALEEIEKTKRKIHEKVLKIVELLIPQEHTEGVVMEIRAAAGGEEAALFAADLFRMYSRYAESKGWKIEIVDFNRTDLGGYKEIVFFVKGENAYKFLKYESGVHRVQRVPITESGGRIHTSTATVAVLPEVSDIDVKIDPKDIKVETFRASGHGGQYVNKTESAVRITHIPTGIVVSIQTERSQHQNREIAMKILRSRLYDLEMRRKKSEMDNLRRSQIGSGERSEKVRTYNFPQNRVTDHRINYTTYRLREILDGDLDEIITKLQEAEIRERILRGDLIENK